MLRLYRARFSTNVERVALALATKGLEAESVWIEYSDRSLVERVSGQPLVPVLDSDGEILTESMDIVRELDRRHPEPWLYPDDPSSLLHFIDWFNDRWKGRPNRIAAELGKPEPDHKLIAELEQCMIDSLDRFENMRARGPYLFGGQLAAAD